MFEGPHQHNSLSFNMCLFCVDTVLRDKDNLGREKTKSLPFMSLHSGGDAMLLCTCYIDLHPVTYLVIRPAASD